MSRNSQELEKTELLKILGTVIRDIRIEKGMTQEELADAVGLTREYMGRLERNIVNISYVNIYKICFVFGIKLSDLFLRAKL